MWDWCLITEYTTKNCCCEYPKASSLFQEKEIITCALRASARTRDVLENTAEKGLITFFKKTRDGDWDVANPTVDKFYLQVRV